MIFAGARVFTERLRMPWSLERKMENGLVFGTSICYTSQNIESVTSDEFIQMLVEKGCRYSLYFHYMPVGNEASPELLPTVEQRTYMHHRVREIRNMEHGPGLLAWTSRMTVSL